VLDLANVSIAADCVTGLQPDLNETCVHGRIGRVNGREAVVYTDVVHDDPKVLGGNGFPDDLLGFGKLLRRNLEPGARRGLNVDDELAGIGLREVRKAEKRIKRKANGKGDAKNRQYLSRLREHPLNEHLELPIRADR
jgi:hypothetical protein